MFAKWIFIVATVFNQGPNDLPAMKQVTPPIADIKAGTEVYETVTRPPCPPGSDACPGFIFTARQRFVFCTAPGVYTFTVRLGLIAQEPLGGKVWLGMPDGSEALLQAFNAAPGMPAYVAASLQAQSLTYESCYRIRVDANRPVEVIADPAVSFVTVGR
jgi:hypothetical protein